MKILMTADPEDDGSSRRRKDRDGLIRFYEFIKGDVYRMCPLDHLTRGAIKKSRQGIGATPIPYFDKSIRNNCIHIKRSRYMARARKDGLDYFPLDVNFLQDRTIRRLTRKHGNMAPTAVIALYSLIYKENRYYLQWSEDVCFDLSELVSTDMLQIHKLVEDALQMEIFDKEQFKKNAILTSVAIQEQYRMCTLKRKKVELIAAYKLIVMPKEEVKGDKNEAMSDANAPSAGISGTEIPQRKVKRKKTPPP